MILAANNWHTNGDLIADIAELYFKPDDLIADITYGRGKWWTRYNHPGRLVACMRNTDIAAFHQAMARGHEPRVLPDFRNMRSLFWVPPGGWPIPLPDVMTFDPPYMAPGGRATSTIPDFNDRYGLVDCAASPRELHEHNRLGLEQCARYIKPGGLIVTKCMDYISSGKLQLGTHWMMTDALEMGLECIDRFEHVGSPRAQPPGRRQVHSRRNLSTMLIFKTPRRRRAAP